MDVTLYRISFFGNSYEVGSIRTYMHPGGGWGGPYLYPQKFHINIYLLRGQKKLNNTLEVNFSAAQTQAQAFWTN